MEKVNFPVLMLPMKLLDEKGCRVRVRWAGEEKMRKAIIQLKSNFFVQEWTKLNKND